jgi:hypothetical protein
MPDWLRTRFASNTDLWERYAPRFTRLEVPARTLLLRENEVAKRAFIIEKGCLRVWFNSQGKDITAQFFFEQQVVSSIESFRQHSPSLFAIETIEPCVVWWLARADVYALLKELGEARPHPQLHGTVRVLHPRHAPAALPATAGPAAASGAAGAAALHSLVPRRQYCAPQPHQKRPLTAA